MQISVVIPTCDRRSRLLSLLHDLEKSTYPIYEIIIVDSGDQKIAANDLAQFKNRILQLESGKSVCIQRNIGIRQAKSEWILLCDDDIELPPDYLEKLTSFLATHPSVGAVSGTWLERKEGQWVAAHPEKSFLVAAWKFIFSLGFWGPIELRSRHFLAKRLADRITAKGNHINDAGWPVLTNFDGESFETPVYSLGASLVRRAWLLNSPYDEALDRFGIGDNYGVILGFPTANITVINGVSVRHHHEERNRLERPKEYYRRALAIDYFIKSKRTPANVKSSRLAWSLMGNLKMFILTGKWILVWPSVKAIWKIITGNPYYRGAREKKKIIEPTL